jgi:hypothetical protein
MRGGAATRIRAASEPLQCPRDPASIVPFLEQPHGLAVAVRRLPAVPLPLRDVSQKTESVRIHPVAPGLAGQLQGLFEV